MIATTWLTTEHHCCTAWPRMGKSKRGNPAITSIGLSHLFGRGEAGGCLWAKAGSRLGMLRSLFSGSNSSGSVDRTLARAA